MKTLFNNHPHYSKRLIMAGFLVLFVFSCSKKTDTPTDIVNHYCGTIDWKSSTGISGYFTGSVISGQYGLEAVSLTDNGKETFKAFHRTNNTSQILNDQSGMTFTYSADKLVKIVMGDATGTATFTFDTNSHLTNTDIESTDETGTTSLKFTYTYDVNDDPVKINGHLIGTSSSGTTTADYDITADYLTDKLNFLPLVPEIAPFTATFAYGFFLSRHLINKWVIKITGTDSQGKPITPQNITQQYSYTYDTNNNVATMSHALNKFTFTYSGCN
jgi:hypothetical protein